MGGCEIANLPEDFLLYIQPFGNDFHDKIRLGDCLLKVHLAYQMAQYFIG